MAVISSKDWRNSTILDLWEGSTRAKHRAWWQASLWAARDSSSNSRPVKALVDTSSSSPKIPIRRQMATAVPLLSPVIIITLMPACLHSFMDEATSILGGSSIPTQPTNVRLVWKDTPSFSARSCRFLLWQQWNNCFPCTLHLSVSWHLGSLLVLPYQILLQMH